MERHPHDVHTYSTPAEVARGVAELFIEVGATAFADRGSFSVALSGGNTPRAAFELLATEPYRSALSWSDVFIYFGDERCVPPDDEQSNFRMASETFLDAVGIPANNVNRIAGEIDPTRAAIQYAQLLRENLGAAPIFDLVLLGLGGDGHTASLFPGTDPTTDTDALVRAVYSTPLDMWRITLTPTVLNAARTVAFAAEGYGKADILAAVLEGPFVPTTYPAQIIAPTSGRLLWLVDAAAAGELKTR